jgi:hypothetical protein
LRCPAGRSTGPSANSLSGTSMRCSRSL